MTLESITRLHHPSFMQLLSFASSPKIMGNAFVNSAITSGITGAIAALVIAINAWAVFEAVVAQANILTNPGLLVLVLLAVVVYLTFLAYLVWLSFFPSSSGAQQLDSSSGDALLGRGAIKSAAEQDELRRGLLSDGLIPWES